MSLKYLFALVHERAGGCGNRNDVGNYDPQQRKSDYEITRKIKGKHGGN